MKFYLSILFSLLLFSTFNAYSQAVQPVDQKTIQGTVTDSLGNPLYPVSVLVKGSNNGTLTNEAGHFSISAPEKAVLIFSMVGYSPLEVNTTGKDQLAVKLFKKGVNLNEMVVVGYSEVEKEHVASSVAQMDMKKISSRPIFKMEDAFTGTMSGVTMRRTNNMPGSIPGSIQIRGISTLQNADPLVIVDGIEQSLTDLDPNQIESITVLKDAASTSMYGSRGANGVIIVKTKRGSTGKFKVDLNSWVAFSQPIELPDFVNSTQYMEINNEARRMQGQSELYTAEDIQKAKSGEIPNVDWLDKVMQKTPIAYNTTASISGGGGVGAFNLMLGHYKENGLNNVEMSEKFSARFNTNINIENKFVLMADFYARHLLVNRLLRNTDGNGLYKNAWKMYPTQQVFYNDTLPEHYQLYNDLNPVAAIAHGGIRNNVHDLSTINLRPTYNITDKLKLEGTVSYTLSKSATKDRRETFKFFDGNGKPVTFWDHAVTSSQGVSTSQVTARLFLNYISSLRKDKDKIYVTGGAEMMNHIFTDYREINKASFFGKVNYSIADRYILEFTGRADGSSKFAPHHWWGFFPAGAVAWNVENESFMQGLKERNIINNLKFRFSYGLIGNDNVDPYLWEEIVNIWGWTMRVPNPDFSWEKQTQWDVGFDLSMLNNRLNVTADLYKKHSFDLIFSDFPVPAMTGSYYLSTSVNVGAVENHGWEFSASWNGKIGNVGYQIGGMIFNNVNKVLKAGYTDKDTLVFSGNNDKIWYKGIAVDNYYGYETNGYFQNEQEVESTDAKMPNTLPGDIRYVDQNNDGIINNEDRVDLGDPYPHYNYSITLDLNYKNWDLRILGQGVGKRQGRLGGMVGYTVLMDGSSNALGKPRQYYVSNRWTPSTPNSRFPRVWTGSSANAYLSDIWLSNAAYFRIKTLQLGYTIPTLGRSIKDVRFYVNAQDALTFTNWEGLDPEKDGSDGSYPRMAIYSVGLSATIF